MMNSEATQNAMLNRRSLLKTTAGAAGALALASIPNGNGRSGR